MTTKFCDLCGKIMIESDQQIDICNKCFVDMGGTLGRCDLDNYYPENDDRTDTCYGFTEV